MANGDDVGITPPPPEPPSPSPLEILTPEQLAAVGRIITRSPFYIDEATFLRVRVTSGAASPGTVRVGWRSVDTAGRSLVSSIDVTPTTAYVTTTVDTALGAGLLFNISAQLTAVAYQAAATFCIVQLVNGRGATATTLATLVSNYVNALQPIAWPGSPVVRSTEGRGVVLAKLGTGQAAGVEVLEFQPFGTIWRLDSFEVDLVCSADVGFRAPALRIINAGNEVMLSAGLTASQTGRLTWGNHLLQTNANAGIRIYLQYPLAGEARMFQTGIQTQTIGLFPLDQYSPPIYTVEEWLTLSF